MLEVCLCTHNPRLGVLRTVVDSLARQTVAPHLFSVLMVDNASQPPVSAEVLEPLAKKGILGRLVVESEPGIFFARNHAMRETTADLVLWVDDDTELPANYLEECLRIAAENPPIGCFGGRMLLGPDCRFPRWSVPLHPYLAVIDRGERPITNKADHWGPWEPPTGGAVVRRRVIEQYLRFVATIPQGSVMGQVGSKHLLRGEDSLLMRMAHTVDLSCSYQPSLSLLHHIENRRFRFRYLFRLMYGYGRSYVRLERLLGAKLPKMRPAQAWAFFWRTRTRKEYPNHLVLLVMKAWNLGFIRESGLRRK